MRRKKYTCVREFHALGDVLRHDSAVLLVASKAAQAKLSLHDHKHCKEW